MAVVGNWKKTLAVMAVALGAVMTAGSTTGGLALADNQCASQCYAQENACRRATNDDPKCGAELTKCLQSCRAQK
jgi:hypothetical protein